MSGFAEKLEVRRLLSASVDSSGTLNVMATASSDVLFLRMVDNRLRVEINGVFTRFDPATIAALSIDLGTGNDRLDVTLKTVSLILGGEGNDTVFAGRGADTINGGGGDDSIDGGAGNDRLYGSGNSDRVFGNDGNDLIFGGNSGDVLDGGTGDDILLGEVGNDRLNGREGNDELFGDVGHDSLFGNEGNDFLHGGAGNDQLSGGDGNDLLKGLAGNDQLVGDDGDDTLYGYEGRNTLNGGEGNDAATGGEEVDQISGGVGADSLAGLGGNDSLSGDNQRDLLKGGDGDDRLSGGADDDILRGGDGDDGLLGGEHDDALYGETGGDRFLLLQGDFAGDVTDADARIIFRNRDAVWTDEEILQLDAGMRQLQERTGSTLLLKMPGGGQITVGRSTTARLEQIMNDTEILAVNFNDGRIDIGDLTFSEDDPDGTMIHELGHNWDDDNVNPSVRDFYDLSNWSQRANGDWIHDEDAVFVNDNAALLPVEDFASSLEVYFTETRNPSQWLEKWDYIDGFLNDVASGNLG